MRAKCEAKEKALTANAAIIDQAPTGITRCRIFSEVGEPEATDKEEETDSAS